MTAIAVSQPSLSRTPRVRPLRLVLLAFGALAAGLGGGLLLAAVVATQFFDFRVLSVSSDSMAPAIKTGDLIVVRPAAIDTVKERDLVLFVAGSDQAPTVHRVVGINEIETQLVDRASGATTTLHDYRLVTKGDNNPAADNGEVEARDLRGQVWFTVPNAGVLAGAGLGLWFAVALAVVLGAWLLWEIVLRLRSRTNTEVSS